VPKTPVDEHGDLRPGEHNVWPDSDIADPDGEILAEAEAALVQG
jgi:hypothetical protein